MVLVDVAAELEESPDIIGTDLGHRLHGDKLDLISDITQDILFKLTLSAFSGFGCTVFEA